ncbi:MAG: cytochrome c3 family protein [Ignavibacteriaceae bacterium]
MKGLLWGLLIFSTFISAQSKKNHSLQNISCKTCHTCDVPTKQNPCLVECPREAMVTVHQPAEKGPDVIKLDKLVKKYMPVNFSHKVHAQMSEMSGGCAGCHHYNTAGPILPCSDCHEEQRKRGDVSKPDLQAAYHRQCITCHKEWSHSTDCNSCHLPKGSPVAKKAPPKGKDHPEVKGPDKLIYETNYNKGKVVTFFHNEHTDLFGADCVSCHQQENCTRCHDKAKNQQPVSSGMPVKISKSAAQHHQPCFKCHQNDECSKCHMDKPTGPFNHKISTGWALNKFHDKLACAKCHGSNKFAKLNNNCVSCHSNFAAGSFNHSVVGLKLDEIHIDMDCGDCHTDNNFAQKPDCSSCHDDKSYPKDKPGTAVKISRK